MERECEHCGGTFEGRANAMTCSPACRQGRSRSRRQKTPSGAFWRRRGFSDERMSATGHGFIERESYRGVERSQGDEDGDDRDT